MWQFRDTAEAKCFETYLNYRLVIRGTDNYNQSLKLKYVQYILYAKCSYGLMDFFWTSLSTAVTCAKYMQGCRSHVITLQQRNELSLTGFV